MKSCTKSITFLVTLFLFGAVIQVIAQDTCHVCMENLAYCVNGRYFYICYDGINPSRDVLLSCDPGQVCSSQPTICEMERFPPLAMCDAESDGCAQCFPNQKFTCVSKTRYALCVNGKPVAATASCGTNEICSVDSIDSKGNICIPQCAADYHNFKPTCSNDVTTTAAPATTASTPKPDTGALRAHCATSCGEEDYCYTTNPSDAATCKTYLYCENVATWEYVVLICKTGIWNNVSKQCDVHATCI